MKNILMFLLFVFSAFYAHGQGDIIELPQIILGFFETSKIGTYGSVPVNLSSRAINCEIPLCRLEGKGVALPIDLRYNNSLAGFVFDGDYNLPGLDFIESYVKEHKHFPEIASAEEMEKNGVNVGEFQTKLLQKIEELMLYTIEQEKKISILKKQVAESIELKDKVNGLESMVQQLLKNKTK